MSYAIVFDVDQGRWHLTAFWTWPATRPPTLETLHKGRVLAVDVNVGKPIWKEGQLAWADPGASPSGSTALGG